MNRCRYPKSRNRTRNGVRKSPRARRRNAERRYCKSPEDATRPAKSAKLTETAPDFERINAFVKLLAAYDPLEDADSVRQWLVFLWQDAYAAGRRAQAEADADLQRLVMALHFTPMSDGTRLRERMDDMSIMNILLEMTEGLGLHISGEVGLGRFRGRRAGIAADGGEEK